MIFKNMSVLIDKLKRKLINLFGIKSQKENNECEQGQNPWAGVASYPDPEDSKERLVFCGRNNEVGQLFRLVDNCLFTTLYGKSGIGKTSLLNAGLFPKLREERYFPISLRLGNLSKGTDLIAQVKNSIEETIKRKIGTSSIELFNLGQFRTDDSTRQLWQYFAERKFYNGQGEVIFPVIVLDQFEEVIRHDSEQAKELLKSIAYLSNPRNAMEDCEIDGKAYEYDFNFRFILSIREDDLYLLEDIIDQNYLSTLKDNRYRLQNLSLTGAYEVVSIVGATCFSDDGKEEMIHKIIEVTKDREGNRVNANLLSLLCSRLYTKAYLSSHPLITLNMVESFFKKDPFSEYYLSAVKGLRNKEREYIEDNLIDDDGRRRSVSEQDFKRNVKEATSLLEGNNRILQRVSGGNAEFDIELIHDAFCDILLKNRLTRKRALITSYYNMLLFLSIGLGVFCMGYGVLAYFINIIFFNASPHKLEILTGILSFFSIMMIPFTIGILSQSVKKGLVLLVINSLSAFITIFLADYLLTNSWAETYARVIDVSHYYYSAPCWIRSMFLLGILIIFLGGLAISIKDQPGLIVRTQDITFIKRYISMYVMLMIGFCAGYISFADLNLVLTPKALGWLPFVFSLLTIWFFSTFKGLRYYFFLTIVFLCLNFICSLIIILFDFWPRINLCAYVVPICAFTIIVSCLIMCFNIKMSHERDARLLLYALFPSLMLYFFMIALGYDPGYIEYKNVKKVFLSRCVINSKNDYLGCLNAQTGYENIPPVFDSFEEDLLLRTLTIKDSNVDVENEFSNQENLISVRRDINNQLMLVCHVFPIFERNLTGVLRNKDNGDNKAISDSKAVQLFISLRNGIIEYILGGDNYSSEPVKKSLMDFSIFLNQQLHNIQEMVKKDGLYVSEDHIGQLVRFKIKIQCIEDLHKALMENNYEKVNAIISSSYIPLFISGRDCVAAFHNRRSEIIL